MKFPYGISDFYQVIREEYLYLDRTAHIATLEALGKQLLFLRPRRFGKSLLLSMLENYYDVAKATEFEELFGKLAIGKQPTLLHNRYFVMKWDFSTVETHSDSTLLRKTLHNQINGAIERFAVHYRKWIEYEIRIDESDALRSFQSLLAAIQTTPYRLYLLIDEYDNFANEVLMSGTNDNRKRYEELVRGESFFRTVFKNIKAASAGQGVDRVFITGVTPVVMSDISSGYNVAENIYLESSLNTLCGFTEEEIQATLLTVARQCGYTSKQSDEAFAMMRTYYNGYRFHPDATDRVYNPTLALYFLKAFERTCAYPEEMLDNNLAMDRSRIVYVSQLGRAERLILSVLDETSPLQIATLAQRFGVEEMLSSDKKSIEYLAALLYYLGVLTLAGRASLSEYVLAIPNLVVRELYVDRLRQLFLPDRSDQEASRLAARNFFLSGNLQALCSFVEQTLFAAFDNRDYLAANELTIKTAFLTLLFNDQLYWIDSENAIQRGYADLTLIRRPDHRQNSELHDLIFEFKYVKLSDLQLSATASKKMSQKEICVLPLVQEKMHEARTQLQTYYVGLRAQYGNGLRLRGYVVVALGFERLVWEQIDFGS